jgi:hypothetical protein
MRGRRRPTRSPSCTFLRGKNGEILNDHAEMDFGNLQAVVMSFSSSRDSEAITKELDFGSIPFGNETLDLG